MFVRFMSEWMEPALKFILRRCCVPDIGGTVEMTACFDDGQISDFHQFKCRKSENATIICFRPLFFFFVLSGLFLMLLKVLTESVFLPKTESLNRKHGTQCRCFAHAPIARWRHPRDDHSIPLYSTLYLASHSKLYSPPFTRQT